MQRRIFHVFLCLIAITAIVFAQSTNNQEISGQVQDATGAVVPGATVTIINVDQNFTRTAKSNESGNFVISNLPIGKYRISAEAAGFKKLLLTDVELTVDSKLAVSLKMETTPGGQFPSATPTAKRRRAPAGTSNGALS